jgi:hypothetical protein
MIQDANKPNDEPMLASRVLINRAKPSCTDSLCTAGLPQVTAYQNRNPAPSVSVSARLRS